MLKIKRGGFTLIETILACSLFAIVISGIVLAINRSFVFMDNTKLAVRASNLAREGMEMMYNIRDTNRRKYSGEKNSHWLSLNNPDYDSYNFIEGIYVLKEKEDDFGNSYFFGNPIMTPESSYYEDFYSDNGFWEYDDREKARLTFAGTYSYYEWNEETDEDWNTDPTYGTIQDAMVGDGLEFYRIVRVFGIYEKNVNGSSVSIPKGSEKLTNGTPAEMRFCVKVFYRSTGKHATELCGVITNFKE